MTRARLFGATLVALILALPALAQNKNTGGVVDADDALRPGTVSGKIQKYSGNSLVLRTESVRYELKPGVTGNSNREVQNIIRQQSELNRAQARVQNARNPRDAARAMQD